MHREIVPLAIKHLFELSVGYEYFHNIFCNTGTSHVFIIVTNDKAFIFVKAYACYYLILVHWRITRHAFNLYRAMK